ncbi:flagellar protein FliT [Dyella agri]|uniref:Flagellar protein FliT n=1 Tax=Dyella agri TaxID=1926869 RepID=A0ABW8KIY8_9GAMM
MSTGHTLLERALAVSSSMLTAARDGRWDSLPRLDAERQPLLRASHPRDRRSRELLQQLLACNEEMLDLAARARAEVADALSRHGYAHHALRTYVDLAR